VNVDSGFDGRTARIEMIALIDVVFLLLVFFIYAMLSMVVQRGVDVVLPGVEGQTAPEGLVITLDRENRLYFEEQRLDLDQIVRRIAARRIAARYEQEQVLIRGDARADLGIAVELLSALREQGVERVSFQVEPQP
jgi:biopolymer transport protein ExbD